MLINFTFEFNLITAVVKPAVKLDTIQEWCEQLAQILWRIREQVKMCMHVCQQAHIAPQSHSDVLPEILQTVTSLLEQLIIRSFIIENPPPQVVLPKKK